MEYVGELRTPAGFSAMSPITSFKARKVWNVGGIDQLYMGRGAESSNDPISFYLFFRSSSWYYGDGNRIGFRR